MLGNLLTDVLKKLKFHKTILVNVQTPFCLVTGGRHMELFINLI